MIIVDFPTPLSPTKAIDEFASILNDKFSITFSKLLYEYDTFLNSMLPVIPFKTFPLINDWSSFESRKSIYLLTVTLFSL